MWPNAALRGLQNFPYVYLLLLLLAAVPPGAHAQQAVALGNATVALTGPWKFHPGDNMAWAQPNNRRLGVGRDGPDAGSV
jgi:hypothetical protein